MFWGHNICCFSLELLRIISHEVKGSCNVFHMNPRNILTSFSELFGSKLRGKPNKREYTIWLTKYMTNSCKNCIFTVFIHKLFKYNNSADSKSLRWACICLIMKNLISSSSVNTSSRSLDKLQIFILWLGNRIRESYSLSFRPIDLLLDSLRRGWLQHQFPWKDERYFKFLEIMDVQMDSTSQLWQKEELIHFLLFLKE